MYKRKYLEKIEKNLNNEYILLLIWARQVWKSTILRKVQKDLEEKWEKTFFINLEKFQNKELLNQDPENIFKIIWNTSNDINEKKYVFIDEIQYLKNPSNFLKYIFDEYKDQIKLICSWSSAFYINKKFTDSLAWRKKIFNIYWLDFREFLIFKEKENLLNILEKKFNPEKKSEIPLIYLDEIKKLRDEFISFWWYPKVVLTEDYEEKKEIISELANSYIKKDILESWIKSEDNYFRILSIISANIWWLFNSNQIAKDLKISIQTVENYLYIMQKFFHIWLIKPFYSNKIKEITKMPKVYFYDLWLRNYFYWDFKNINLRHDKWELFENFTFLNLLSSFEKDKIQFWRDKDKHEVDFIINDIEKKSAFEVKFNAEKFQKSKYKVFIEKYKNLNLKVLDFENFF